MLFVRSALVLSTDCIQPVIERSCVAMSSSLALVEVFCSSTVAIAVASCVSTTVGLFLGARSRAKDAIEPRDGIYSSNSKIAADRKQIYRSSEPRIETGLKIPIVTI